MAFCGYLGIWELDTWGHSIRLLTNASITTRIQHWLIYYYCAFDRIGYTCLMKYAFCWFYLRTWASWMCTCRVENNINSQFDTYWFHRGFECTRTSQSGEQHSHIYSSLTRVPEYKLIKWRRFRAENFVHFYSIQICHFFNTESSSRAWMLLIYGQTRCFSHSFFSDGPNNCHWIIN